MCLPFLAFLAPAAASGGTAAAIGTMTAVSLIGTGISAYSQYEQGQYQGEVAQNNAMIKNRMATDAIKRGENAEADHRRQVALVKSKQKANFGASGINAGVGSAFNMMQDTGDFGELDAQIIRSNAQRQAYGYEVGGMNDLAGGELAERAGTLNAAGTLISGAGTVSRDWYMYNNGFTNETVPVNPTG